MMDRRKFFSNISASLTIMALSPVSALGQSSAPSAKLIEKKLSVSPQIVLPPKKRIARKQLKRRHDLRRHAPSIEIQAINFAFGSAQIPYQELWKVNEIAIAMRRMLARRPHEVFLIEGHTDAVGSRYNNQLLSQDRARSLKRHLRRKGVDPFALETVGYGEEFLLVPTKLAEWRNRRVTLRRVTDFITR